MKVLFIGGTGTISSACADLVSPAGHDLTLLCRGVTDRPVTPTVPGSCTRDVRDPPPSAPPSDTTPSMSSSTGSPTPRNTSSPTSICSGARSANTSSSAPRRSTRRPRRGCPSRDLAARESGLGLRAGEDRLRRAARPRRRDERFPVTIVRPSHTYDERTLPVRGGWTVVDRMRRGQAGRRARRRHQPLGADAPRRLRQGVRARCSATPPRSGTRSTSRPTTC